MTLNVAFYAVAVPYVFFDVESNATFTIANVACIGNETNLLNCTHSDTPNCVESEEVGLICIQQIGKQSPVCHCSQLSSHGMITKRLFEVPTVETEL